MEYSIQYDGVDAVQPGSSSSSNYNVVNVPGSQGCMLGTESDGNTFNTSVHGCLLQFKIDKAMKAPIYVYYQLDNFYQNHRRYVASRSDEQLRGVVTTATSECDPMITTKDNTTFKYDSVNNTAIAEGQWTLNPCGLIANSLFNGKFPYHLSY